MPTKRQRPPSFPKDFVWGAAAAAYQVEGAARADGKAPSVWDMLCRKEDAIWGGQSGDVACDHYRRYKQDVALMKRIGLQAYRLSVSWPRVIPQGAGAVNPKGLAFYDRLVDRLLAAGVTPFVTLFHWDYPYALYCRGGWLNPDSPDWFADYAGVVVKKLSDRVRHWMTLNEPVCFIDLGMRVGRHAPGDKLGWAEVLRAAHHALLAHGKAVQAIRARSRSRCRVGFAPVANICVPATDKPADIAAARRAMFGFDRRTLWVHTWWNDPIFFGRYPADGLRVFGKDAPRVATGDMKTIRQPLDFFGVNIYSGQTVRAGRDGKPQTVPLPPGHDLTAFRWPVTPSALYWGPRFLHERYRAPIYITENGMSNTDWIARDGAVHDPQRIDFTARYLRELRRAIADGVDVRGYFHWSIMDNFEWAEGFKERFGLIYVDYPTQRRVLKDSAYWYRQLIAANGANL
jgi:beta-glucosidase